MGDILVWAAVFAAGVAVVGPSSAVAARTRACARLASAIASSLALAFLASRFLAQDWSYEYVADNTRSGIGPLLRMAGLWAGAEGSLLLWVAMVAWMAVIAGRSRLATDHGPRLGAGLAMAYGLVVAIAASPFQRLDIPAIDGLGLQPVLEHRAMIWHPPILYAGLVGMLLPTVVGLGAVLAGRRPQVDPQSVRVPMALLTLGLVSGAVWANVELGWGGYWAWDPIESAGLVAWLAGATLLHLMRRPEEIVENRRARIATFAIPGLASIWATTLTRIGVIDSVHAFADRPALRIALLSVAALVSAVVVAVLSGPPTTPDEVDPAPVDPDVVDPLATGRSQARRLAVIVLATATLFVAVGTYEPLVEAATTGDTFAIAGRYYSRLLWPVVIVGAVLAVRADRKGRAAGVGAVVGLVIVPLAAGPFGLALGAAGGAVAASAIGLVRSGRRGALAHVGVGIALIGIGGTIATTVDTVDLPVGGTTTIHGIELTHRSVELVDGRAVRSAVATVEVDGVALQPRLVAYQLRGVSTAEVAHRFRLADEVQVVLLDGDEGSARYRINRLPRVGLVWLGALILALGLLAEAAQAFLSPRRLRANSSDNVDESSPDPASSPEPEPVPEPDGGPVGADGTADV